MLLIERSFLNKIFRISKKVINLIKMSASKKSNMHQSKIINQNVFYFKSQPESLNAEILLH